MKNPLDSRRALVLWHLGLALAVGVSWGCFGAAGAFMLNEGLGLSHEPTLVVMIDRTTGRAQVYETPHPWDEVRKLPSMVVKVDGRTLPPATDRLAGPAPKGDEVVVTLEPGLLEAYDIRLWTPRVKKFAVFRPPGNTSFQARFLLENAEETQRRVQLEIRGVEADGSERNFGHLKSTGLRDGQNHFTTSGDGRPKKVCLDAVPRFHRGIHPDETLLGAELDARVRLACVDPETH